MRLCSLSLLWFALSGRRRRILRLRLLEFGWIHLKRRRSSSTFPRPSLSSFWSIQQYAWCCWKLTPLSSLLKWDWRYLRFHVPWYLSRLHSLNSLRSPIQIAHCVWSERRTVHRLPPFWPLLRLLHFYYIIEQLRDGSRCGILIEDIACLVVDDCVEAINYGEMGLVDLVVPPAVEFAFVVDGKGRASGSGTDVDYKGSACELVYLPRIDRLNIRCEMPLAKLPILIKAKTPNRSQRTQHQSIPKTTADFPDIFLAQNEGGTFNAQMWFKVI